VEILVSQIRHKIQRKSLTLHLIRKKNLVKSLKNTPYAKENQSITKSILNLVIDGFYRRLVSPNPDAVLVPVPLLPAELLVVVVVLPNQPVLS